MPHTETANRSSRRHLDPALKQALHRDSKPKLGDMTATTINVHEEFSTAGSVDAVWQAMTDPLVVVQCLPGTSIRTVYPDGSIDGEVSIKLGPTEVSFLGTVIPTFASSTCTGTLDATGADGRGRTKARALTTFSVEEGAPAGSRVVIDGSVTVSGPLAPFVRTGGTFLTKRLVADFARNLQALVEPSAPAEDRSRPGDDAIVTDEDANRSSGSAHRPGGRLVGWLRRISKRLGFSGLRGGGRS